MSAYREIGLSAVNREHPVGFQNLAMGSLLLRAQRPEPPAENLNE